MSKKPDYEFKNLTKQQEACLSLIETLGIYELRSLARVFGDETPSLEKRNDHIRFIMNKIITGEDLKPIPMRQGRPYKVLSNIEGILAELSQLTGKDYTLKSSSYNGSQSTQKAVSFNQFEEDVFQKKLFPIEVAGTVCQSASRDLYLLNEQTGQIIYVPRDMSLKTDDHITGTAIIMNSAHDYVLDEIQTINFKDFRMYSDRENAYEEDVLPTESLPYENKRINLGGRYLIADITEKPEDTKSLIKMLKRNGIICIAFLPNMMKDEVAQINEIGFDATYMTQYNDTPFKVYETLQAFMATIKKLQSQGLKLALFIDNIFTLADSVDYAFKSNAKVSMGHTEISISTIKELVNLARSGGEGKHTTLFATLDEADLFDPLYVTCVYKVSKKLNV